MRQRRQSNHLQLAEGVRFFRCPGGASGRILDPLFLVASFVLVP